LRECTLIPSSLLSDVYLGREMPIGSSHELTASRSSSVVSISSVMANALALAASHQVTTVST
jgi:hypothetical protein